MSKIRVEMEIDEEYEQELFKVLDIADNEVRNPHIKAFHTYRVEDE